MSHGSDWPLDESVRIPARPPRPAARRRPLPRAVWAIAAAAFVGGVLISAAAFSVGWRHQAQHSSSAEAALAAATAKTHTLGASLAAALATTARTRAQLATARKAEAAATAAAQSVTRDATAIASQLVATGRSADSVSVGASSLGASLDRLAGELKTLTSYLTTTSPSQLDGGYVATQTAYLAKQLDELQSTRGDLGSAIAAFQAAAKKLADRAATLSGRN
jgi:hypothetical protein